MKKTDKTKFKLKQRPASWKRKVLERWNRMEQVARTEDGKCRKGMKRTSPPKKMKCICKEELGYWGDEHIYVHLAWCPESYVYQDAVKEYEAASCFKRFWRQMKDPRKYHNFLWSPPY